ncbi:mitochondrial, partial [Brachionus plicatilis]
KNYLKIKLKQNKTNKTVVRQNFSSYFWLSKSLISTRNNLTKMTEVSQANLKEKSNYIVWVDLEMSGLNIDKDHILEIACLITDKNLNTVAEGPELIIHQSNEVLNGMDEWCTKTHGESGLTASCRSSQINIEQAEQIMLEFVQKHIPKGACPLAGNSIHVDRIFLNKYMKNFLNYLHYRIIDVSTIKELAKRWSDERQFFVKKQTHRALDDIKESIDELKYYRIKFFK